MSIEHLSSQEQGDGADLSTIEAAIRNAETKHETPNTAVHEVAHALHEHLRTFIERLSPPAAKMGRAFAFGTAMALAATAMQPQTVRAAESSKATAAKQSAEQKKGAGKDEQLPEPPPIQDEKQKTTGEKPPQHESPSARAERGLRDIFGAVKDALPSAPKLPGSDTAKAKASAFYEKGVPGLFDSTTEEAADSLANSATDKATTVLHGAQKVEGWVDQVTPGEGTREVIQEEEQSIRRGEREARHASRPYGPGALSTNKSFLGGAVKFKASTGPNKPKKQPNNHRSSNNRGK